MSNQSTQNASLKTQNSYLDMDMLRFTTAGSVDDGKKYPNWSTSL